MTEADEILAYEEGRLRGLEEVHQFLYNQIVWNKDYAAKNQKLFETQLPIFVYVDKEIAAANELIQEIRGEEE